MTNFERAKQYGYTRAMGNAPFYSSRTWSNALDSQLTYWNKNEAFIPPVTPKMGSHDSGALTGFFFGGFGTAGFARGAHGFFDRWQLQQGIPVICPIDNAYIAVRWEQDGKIYNKKLRVAEDGFNTSDVTSHALFPLCYEEYEQENMPFKVLLEGYSPIIPHNLKDSVLPVTVFNIYIEPKTDKNIPVSVMLSWPNLLGWKHSGMASEMRGEDLWPSHQNSGNFGRVYENSDNRLHILQGKTFLGDPNDLSGEVMLSMDYSGWKASYNVMAKDTRATTGFEDEAQCYTVGKIKSDFERFGELDSTDTVWECHWHEPMVSAMAANTVLGSDTKKLSITITMALPITEFGMGRQWYKLYTENKELSKAIDIANYALASNDRWLSAIGNFHEDSLNAEQGNEDFAATKINELYFVTSGGAVLVSQPVKGWDSETEALGRHPHYGLLEGFDTGYYYYNTLDLWVYGFAALSKNWRELAEWGFADYLASAKLTESRQNMIYRDSKLIDNLIYGKLPHDLGSCSEDLFVRLNGYNFRDTPNMWKDHNPSFILAFYLHKTLAKLPVTNAEYEILKTIMEFTIKQDNENTGIPKHNEFGDSTWDNLNMQGLSAYCGSLCIGAYAVMAKLAEKFNDSDRTLYEEKLSLSQKSMENLWNGNYYVTSENGKYKNATMSDSLFGIMLAHKAGIENLLPMDKIVSHLNNTYLNNTAAFSNGEYGALLVAEPNVQKYERDGGDEMQVNEVIVGSSWVLAACLDEFGLKDKAKAMEKAMRNTIEHYGLQFRTPAAWNNADKFRAPMNMRPMAVWLI